jgi:mRNA interferase MazF
MEGFIAGDIVVIPFPFTDSSFQRKRPALILSNLQGDDFVVCEITSRLRNDLYSVIIEDKDTKNGRLKTKSIVRPNRLFTINKSRINYKFDEIKENKLKEVFEKVKTIFNFR